MQYDPYGNVISNTLPAALAETLVNHLDPATGLQYHGDRHYDAWPGGYVQPNSSGGLPGMPQSLNRYTYNLTGWPSNSTLIDNMEYRSTAATTVDLSLLVNINWQLQQGVSQGINYGTRWLSGYSLIRFSVSASRHKLLNHLPERAVELLGGRSIVEALPANRTIQTLSTGGTRLIRGQGLVRSMFDDFTKGTGRWTGKLGDDFFSHSFTWLSTRWFGVTSAGVGDAAIQWFWPGTGDVWNYQEYGLTPGKFAGRGAVAAVGGLAAWGAVELTAALLVAGGVIAAPAEIPFLAAAGVFIAAEALYEWQAKPRLYKWLDLKGTNEY